MLNEGMNYEERSLYSELKHYWNIHSFALHAQGTCLYTKENKHTAEICHLDSSIGTAVSNNIGIFKMQIFKTE